MKRMINAAYCKNCGCLVVSKHRHDWQCCDCYVESQDFATRHNLVDGQDVEISSPSGTKFVKKFIWRGFFLDDGSDYTRMGGNFRDIGKLKVVK